MHSYAQLQAALNGPDKKSAIDQLHDLFPHKTKSYFNRNYLHMKNLDPLGLSRALGYADPTGEAATALADKEIGRQRCNADDPETSKRSNHQSL